MCRSLELCQVFYHRRYNLSSYRNGSHYEHDSCYNWHSYSYYRSYLEGVMDMIELPPTPRVLVRVQGGEKRLAVDVILLNFDDEVDVNGDDLFDSYCKQLLTYLRHLTS